MVNKENNMKILHIAIISAALSAFAGVPISRTVDVSATIKPVHLETYAGETLDLSVQLASGGSPLATPSASATIYWQTNGMANAWWQTNMSCSASGLVTGSWSPGLPSGRVWFFVGVESSGLNYRIAGQCAILPSPGGAPSTAVLPPPGGTLNLGDYTIIGAPWITSSDSAAAIASATDPLARDISALSARADEAATAASNYTDSVAAPLIAATNSITASLDSIVIPDVSGFASKTSLQAASNSLAEAVQQSSNALAQATAALSQTVAENANQSSSAIVSATNALHTSFAPTVQLASTALQPSASNALAQAIAVLEQTIAYNAQQAVYDLSAASNALAQATSALEQTVAYNAQQADYDLSAVSNALSQAIAALYQTVADNAQQSSSDLISATNTLHTSLAPTVQLASTALQPSATNGIPEEITSATNALNQSLAPTISSTSNALAQATADLAQKVDGLAMAMAASNTAYRLMSLDGETYQDATGTVWRAETSIGTSQWYVVSIAYTNGTTVSTNEIPGISSWSIDGDYLIGDPPQWIWTLSVPAGGSEYAKIGGAEDATPADMNLEFQLSGGDISSLYFSRTNTVSHYWSPVDHVLYASSGGGSSGLSTNDVCAIVTNEARIVSAWTIEGLQPGDTYQFLDDGPGYYGWSWILIVTDKDGNMYYSSTGWTTEGPDDATKVVFDGGFVATRTIEIKNALGLAREKDLPQNNAVDEILLNGADGKIYHLRIGAGGSIDIYTEVTP